MPKRRRSNLDLRWSIGIFLGTIMSSNEALIGLPNGDVTRARSVARLIPSQQWEPERILAITGTPAKPTASGFDDAQLESLFHPHLLLDAEQVALMDEDREPVDTGMHLCLHVDRRLPPFASQRRISPSTASLTDAPGVAIQRWTLLALSIQITLTHVAAGCTKLCTARMMQSC